MFVVCFKKCGWSVEQVATDSDLRGGCPYNRHYLRSCREDCRVCDRPLRAVKNSAPKKMSGLEKGWIKMHNVE